MPTTTLRPCIDCGMPTRSTLRLCQGCRPAAAERPARPCTGCGEKTTAKDGACLECRPTKRAHPGAVPCTECEIEMTVTGVCSGCRLAISDDTGVRGLGESPYDLDRVGIWRFDPVRRVHVLVRLDEEAAA